MKSEDVTAKIGTDGTPVTIKCNFAENLDELVDQFTVEGEEGSGEKLVYAHSRASMIVALQGKMRNLMDPEREGGPMTAAQIQAELVNPDGSLKWRPGTRAPGKTAAEKIAELTAKMDPETRKKLLAQLAEEAGGAPTPAAGNGGQKAAPAQAAQTQPPGRQPAAKQAANQRPQRGR
jgi:hypothetical protein